MFCNWKLKVITILLKSFTSFKFKAYFLLNCIGSSNSYPRPWIGPLISDLTLYHKLVGGFLYLTFTRQTYPKRFIIYPNTCMTCENFTWMLSDIFSNIFTTLLSLAYNSITRLLLVLLRTPNGGISINTTL